jgi:hypothetical protein
MQTRLILSALISFAGIFALAAPVFNRKKESTPTFLATGKNTLSCLLNNKEIVENTYLNAEVVHENNLFYLNVWMGEGRKNRITFVLKDEEISERTYDLDDSNKRYLTFSFHQMMCTYTSDEYYNGMLMINTYDKEKRIIAGSFEFIAFSDACNELVRVEDGHFDATF